MIGLGSLLRPRLVEAVNSLGEVLFWEPFSDFCWIEPAIFGIEKITRKFMVCFAGK
jgi:hypothetical protein|tara:strand:- start:1357 stop:1524 length:168 start_codon:yes stop_codon:yes gene_type:complete